MRKIMSLSFFAKRMGVSVHRLSWCIVYTKNEDGEKKETPAICIDGSAQCFNILNDSLETLLNVGGCQTVVTKARVNETESGYEFRPSKGDRLLVTFEEIQKVYENKIYSKELERKAQRFA